MRKTVMISGLGLIGGSMAKAIRDRTDCRILGFDTAGTVLSEALSRGVIDDTAGTDNLHTVDLLLVALYPMATVECILKRLPQLKKGAVVIDLCGVKQYVCERIAPAAKQYGITYIGGHPMAGRELSGFSASQKTLFEGASMILVPDEGTEERVLCETEEFFRRLGFAQTVRTTAKQHDAMVAFTSQLAHVVSSAYIKSPEALRHDGYSAGSYKDLTRVAKLNETMWTELFLANREALVWEIDEIMRHLAEYRDAIAEDDAPTLCNLLREGRERKEQIG